MNIKIEPNGAISIRCSLAEIGQSAELIVNLSSQPPSASWCPYPRQGPSQNLGKEPRYKMKSPATRE